MSKNVFNLILSDGANIKKEGVDCLEFLKENGIENPINEFSLYSNIELEFCEEEILGCNFLRALFKNVNIYCIYCIMDNKCYIDFSNMIDIKKSYESNKAELKENYKEIFFKDINKYLDSLSYDVVEEPTPKFKCKNFMLIYDNRDVLKLKELWFDNSNFKKNGFNLYPILREEYNPLNQMSIEEVKEDLSNLCDIMKTTYHIDIDKMLEPEKKELELKPEKPVGLSLNSFRQGKYIIQLYKSGTVHRVDLLEKYIALLEMTETKIERINYILDTPNREDIYLYFDAALDVIGVSTSADDKIKVINIDDLDYLNYYLEYNKIIVQSIPTPNHEWVLFVACDNGHYLIKFDEGCIYSNFIDTDKTLKTFEKNVIEKYGSEKDSKSYRIYTMIDEWIRIYSDIKDSNAILFYKFIKLIEENKDKIKHNLEELSNSSNEEDKKYLLKNKFWFDIIFNKQYEDIVYLEDDNGSFEDEYYYDLICLKYLDHWYAIPVPVLSKLAEIKEELYIFVSFKVHTGRYAAGFEFI